MVLGSIQLVKVYDKVITQIKLFLTDCGYYMYFVDLDVPWILSSTHGYYPHFVNIVDISSFSGYYLYLSHYKLRSNYFLSYPSH